MKIEAGRIMVRRSHGEKNRTRERETTYIHDRDCTVEGGARGARKKRPFS